MVFRGTVILRKCAIAAAAASFASRAIQSPVMAQPAGRLVKAAVVTGIEGTVRNAKALADGCGFTTLQVKSGGSAATIVLDYGKDVEGVPVLTVVASNGDPLVKEVFSESLTHLLPDGDGASVVPNAPGDPSRADVFVVHRAGKILNQQMQGGERYEAISVLTPGSVTLARAGIMAVSASPGNAANHGAFQSNDMRLNAIWNLGARTLHLCEVDKRSLRPLLGVTPAGLVADASPPAVYQFGANWSDYTVSVETKILRNEGVIIARASLLGALNFSFHADDDRVGKPNTLDVWEMNAFSGRMELHSMKLPIDLKPGTWNAIRVVLRGKEISVFLDSKKVTEFTSRVAVGGVGFRNASDGMALFRNLFVANASGVTLYASTLRRPGVVRDFGAGTNSLAAIFDGVKRDRIVYSGDLSMAAPTVYYATGQYRYVAGSLALLGSFQRRDGEIASFASPLLDARLGSGRELPAGAGFYSASYSMHFVIDAYTYYLYSGDKGFLVHYWPKINGELSYLRRHVDTDGLLRTDEDNGLDWALDLQTGAVTEYNALYYRVLEVSAAMAQTLGQGAYVNQLKEEAYRVKDGVNRRLYDPSTGVYDVSSDHRGTYALDANVMAILYGLARRSTAHSILQRIARKLNTRNGPRAFSDGQGFSDVISPFMIGYEVCALFQIGNASEALKLIRTVWGRMADPSYRFYTDATFEALGLDGDPQRATTSLAHAWSTGPTAALSKYVLGVRPVNPGFSSWRIEPETDGLRWAKGQVPTQHGPIVVSWQKDSKTGSLRLSARIPNGTTGTIALPWSKGDTLVVNGCARLSAAEPHREALGDVIEIKNVRAGWCVIETRNSR